MKISVITVCFNAEKEIEKTLRSVIGQTYRDFEYIVVDGKSTDRTLDIIQRYSDRITCIISEPDTGIYNAMNKGVRLAKGEYCLFMNAGDTFANAQALQLASLFLNDGFDVLVGREISMKDGKIIDYVYPPQEITPMHLYRSSLSHQSAFIRREALLRYPYDETLRLVSDWKFWIEALLVNHLKYRAIDVDVSCFNHDGMTYTQTDLGKRERKLVMETCMPKEMLEACRKEAKRFSMKWQLYRVKRRMKRIANLKRLANYNMEWY